VSVDVPIFGQLTRDDIRLIRALVDERCELWRKHREIWLKPVIPRQGKKSRLTLFSIWTQ